MISKLGLHWLREHPDNKRDFAHIERMQYRSVKPFKPLWDNRDASRDLLSVLPQDSYILARDHDLSEQKEDSYRDPVGTGTRHANEWADKVRGGQYHLPPDRSFFLGINEPNADSGDRAAIDRYTVAFLNRLKQHGLRGGAFGFSTGHPRTVDGTPHTPADYSVFEPSHRAIVEGHHIGVLHIYGTAAVPLAPGHYDRLRACPWQDVEWIVGECGVDEHVIGGGAHDGYLRSMADNPARYCDWLDDFILGINDSRIHSYQVFTYDFSHPWDSFDTRPIRDALEAYDWQHVKAATKPPPVDVHIPSVIAPGPTPPKPQEPKIPYGARIVTTVTANLREWSSLQSRIIREVPPGTVFDMVGYNEDWYQVPRGDGEGDGWLHRSVVKQASPPPSTPTGEGDWARIYAFIKRWEGGFVNDPNDPGGPTNKGVTLATYTRWRQAHGQPQPTIEDLRDIGDAEVEKIFYEWYYLASGADKLPWPVNLAQADTAVNAGVGRANEMLQKSNGNFLAYMGHLIDWYTRINNFEHFGRAWIRRRAEILLEASKP